MAWPRNLLPEKDKTVSIETRKVTVMEPKVYLEPYGLINFDEKAFISLSFRNGMYHINSYSGRPYNMGGFEVTEAQLLAFRDLIDEMIKNVRTNPQVK